MGVNRGVLPNVLKELMILLGRTCVDTAWQAAYSAAASPVAAPAAATAASPATTPAGPAARPAASSARVPAAARPSAGAAENASDEARRTHLSAATATVGSCKQSTLLGSSGRIGSRRWLAAWPRAYAPFGRPHWPGLSIPRVRGRDRTQRARSRTHGRAAGGIG
jgi:hypothetical protein